MASLKAGSSFTTTYDLARRLIETYYGLHSDPVTITPNYTAATVGTDAGNLGLILGAMINQDQYLCPGEPGSLVTSLSADIADGVFDGLSFGNPVPYCHGLLDSIAGTAEFQDALSGMTQLRNVTHAFVFGGAGNVLTTNGLANLALDGTKTYALAPFVGIDEAIAAAAPKPQNNFAPVAGTATMNAARASATGTLLPNGLVLIAGGFNGRSVLASTDLYDPLSNSFIAPGSTATMNAARDLATATLLPNGLVLIAGGHTGSSTFLASTELYDPSSNSFALPANTPTMITERAEATATLLPNGLVLIAGGTGIGSITLFSTELYEIPWATISLRSGSRKR